VSLNGGSQLARLLQTQTYIDLPPIAPQGIYDIFISVPGALVGDVVYFCPLADLYNGLWTFNINAAVTAASVVRIYFHNLYNNSLDVGAFSAKVVVMAFN
jgi:hypothetical protein